MSTKKYRYFTDPVLIGLILISLMFPSAVTLIHSQATSPLDEWVFIDYTSKVFEQGFVHDGERIGELTNTIMACDGVIPGGTFGRCGDDLAANSQNLPYTGLTAAAAYTPVYFAITRLFGLPLEFVGFNPLTAWRLTGGIWLAAAVAVQVMTMRRWRIPDGTILPLGLLLISSPYVWWAHTFVSTDAPSLLVGALLLYISTRIRQGDKWGWVLALTAVAATALKVTNLVAVGLAVVYLMGSWLVDWVRFKKQREQHVKTRLIQEVVWPLGSVLLSVGLQWGWSKFIVATAIQGDRANQGISSPLSLSELGLQTTNFLSRVLSYSPFTGHGHDFLFTPLAWVLIAGVLGAFFVLQPTGDRWQIAAATFIAAIVMAPVLAIAVQVAQGSYFQLSPRYGASLVPAFLLSTAFVLRNCFARWAVGLYSGGLFLVGLAAAFRLN